ETPTRKATTRNMKLVREAGAPRAHSLPSRRAVWKALRHKDLSKQIKTFFWIGIHGAHRVGAYWKHLPSFEERELCHWCRLTESLEHVLFE
ncbi:hypothetical protein B0H13DRAFT_1606451, partial [Mycena leptocephala]